MAILGAFLIAVAGTASVEAWVIHSSLHIVQIQLALHTLMTSFLAVLRALVAARDFAMFIELAIVLTLLAISVAHSMPAWGIALRSSPLLDHLSGLLHVPVVLFLHLVDSVLSVTAALLPLIVTPPLVMLSVHVADSTWSAVLAAEFWALGVFGALTGVWVAVIALSFFALVVALTVHALLVARVLSLPLVMLSLLVADSTWSAVHAAELWALGVFGALTGAWVAVIALLFALVVALTVHALLVARVLSLPLVMLSVYVADSTWSAVLAAELWALGVFGALTGAWVAVIALIFFALLVALTFMALAPAWVVHFHLFTVEVFVAHGAASAGISALAGALGAFFASD